MIRTLLFDLGNVLLYFSHERMCAQLGALGGITSTAMRSQLFESGLQAAFERGQISEPEFHTRLEQQFARTLEPAAVRVAGCDIFELNPPMLPLLHDLRSQGYRLVLLSNTCIAHFEFVRQRFSVLQAFDDFVLSFRVGAMKPDEAIFRAALEAIQCRPEECFYTDDIPEYVLAARQFGLHAEVFEGAAGLTQHLARLGVTVSSVNSTQASPTAC